MGGGAGAAPGSGRWIDGVPALLRWDTPSDVPQRAQRELRRILRARFDALDLGWADTDEPELELPPIPFCRRSV